MSLFKKGASPQTLFLYSMLVILSCLLLATLSLGDEETIHGPEKIDNYPVFHRFKRGDADGSGDEASNKNETSKEEDKPTEISLSVILGIMFLVCTIFYCIGIGYKIFKIIKGTYVEEEPVFLKYK